MEPRRFQRGGSVRSQGALASARLIPGRVRGRCGRVQTVHPRPRPGGRGAPRSAPGGSAAGPVGGGATSGPAPRAPIARTRPPSCGSPCAGGCAIRSASGTVPTGSSSAASRSATSRSAPERGRGAGAGRRRGRGPPRGRSVVGAGLIRRCESRRGVGAIPNVIGRGRGGGRTSVPTRAGRQGIGAGRAARCVHGVVVSHQSPPPLSEGLPDIRPARRPSCSNRGMRPDAHQVSQ